MLVIALGFIFPAFAEDEIILHESAPVFDVADLPTGMPLEDEDAYVDWMMDKTGHEEKFLRQRWDRAQVSLTHYNPPDITHQRVLEAFLWTPREYFVRPWNLEYTYAHRYNGIGYGQTISGPHIVSRMTDEINPDPDMKVLEIGTGSGYQAAVLSHLSNYVYSIEIVEGLAEDTDDIYQEWWDKYPQFKNVNRKIADGYYGWEEYAPFDRIIVTCGIDHIPPALLKQLSGDGGIMVIPVGPPSAQKLLRIIKQENDDGTTTITREDIYEGTGREEVVVFVPFTAEGGSEKHSVQRDR